MTPLSTSGRRSTAASGDAGAPGRFPHASEPKCACLRAPDPAGDRHGDGPAGPATTPVRVGCAPGGRHRAGDRPHLARRPAPPGPAGLGAPGDGLRPGTPGRGPGGARGHTGSNGGGGPGLLRGPGGRQGSRLGGPHGNGRPTPAHDVRAGDGDGRGGRGGGTGRGDRHGGRERFALHGDVRPLGPAPRRGVREPAVAPAAVAPAQGPVEAAAAGPHAARGDGGPCLGEVESLGPGGHSGTLLRRAAERPGVSPEALSPAHPAAPSTQPHP